ncbi:hypothetical protein VL23_16100 [Stenotrophomonas maltophilia]|uniref:Uncharacterized protein n=1 Tax=Stenotrophomonas maltophilia TaxID=40324 RepID=A0AB34TFM0_STEMA|nr:hypothetical protein VL23_16100 [Stenotrophomonas maltophilia]
MMPALDLLQPVAHRLQEVVVGLQDGAIEGELDDRLDPVQRRDLRLEFGTGIGRRIDAGAGMGSQRAQQGTPRRTSGYAARPAPARLP